MDFANYSKSLSQMVSHEVFRDCNNACFNDSGSTFVPPSKDCVTNCASRHAQFISAFDKVAKSEIPRIKELATLL